VFKKLKERFTKEPVLAVPNLYKIRIDIDRCIRLCNQRGIIYRV